MNRKILFLCTGNYYRSRFAEMLFNHLATIHEHPWQAFSRGLAIELLEQDAGPISPHTLNGLAARSILLDEEVRDPIALAEADLKEADHIVALKQAEHLPLMLEKFPHWVERVEFWHVHDIDMGMPHDALQQIELEVHKLLWRLLPKEEYGDE